MPGTGSPSKPRPPLASERDGTSQSNRLLPALAPAYVGLDERTTANLVAFARAYSRELRYIDAQGQPAGDWSRFIPANLSAEEVAGFLQDPESHDPSTAPDLFRPHFVLFLVFLKLLERSRAQLNSLTARHLDFYFRQYLRLQPKPSIADRVNVIIELARGAKTLLLPAGTQLNAGPDATGIDRIYATDRDLFVNRAQVASLRSLYIDCRRTTLRHAPLRHPNDSERICEHMFRIALADPLPLFADGREVNFATLRSLHDTLRQGESETFFPIATLRELMTRMALRPAAPAEWKEINSKLVIAGTAYRNGGAFSIEESSQDFYGNLERAVGPVSVATLPQVATFDDLYDQRNTAAVQTFVAQTLHFANFDDFLRMMQLKRKFESDWRAINALLEQAGARQRNDALYSLSVTQLDAFADNLQTALGLSTSRLDQQWALVSQVEAYFCMPAEHFLFALDEVITKPIAEWEQIYVLLEDAHRERLRRERLAAIRALHQSSPSIRTVDLIRFVLGEAASAGDDATAADRLAPYIGQSNVDTLLKLASEASWDRVYSLLELAQRARLGEPAAEQSEWLNLYPAADATAIRRSEGETAAGDSPRFPAFGAARPARDPLVPPAPVLGWALSSPILFLREGARSITLTLGFTAGSGDLRTAFESLGELALSCELSTAKGFVSCPIGSLTYGDYETLVPGTSATGLRGLQLMLSLDETAEAISTLPSPGAIYDSPYPILRLLLKPIYSIDHGQFRAPYAELAPLVLAAAQVHVVVSGLRNLSLQNDETRLDAKKPFEPFTNQPAVGSRLLLGHPEVVGKTLDSLSLSLQWMGAPANPTTYYAIYGLTAATPFNAQLCMIDRSRTTTLLPATPLFGSTGSASVTLSAGPGPAVDSSRAAALLANQRGLDADVLNWERYLALELNSPDFQHSTYPVLAGSKAVELAVATAAGGSITAASYMVPPPYTPKIKSLTLSYSSTQELRFDSERADAQIHRALHIHPFGYCAVEIERDSTAGGVPFLPPYPNDGELYLGLRDLAAPQSVSLFFQMAEGTADAELPQAEVSWSYLSGDRWQPLSREVLLDTTRGLRSSGLVELALPATSPSTRLRDPLYFLRATIKRDPSTVCEVIGLHTQAVSATFVDRGNSPAHFADRLPADSITQLARSRPEVSKVRQPYTSYGGRPAESDDTWALRVSERLRHKGRAVSLWDYERLALAQFPELHKVKCIPAPPDRPGLVTLIAIPNIRRQLPFEPFAPRVSANLLSQVGEYLRARAPDSAEIVVKNAHYVAVRVRIGVRFSESGHDEFYQQKLNEDLNRFLSPWAYEDGADIAMGGKIYASSIVDFVDRLPYVDYVAGISLFRSDDGVAFRPVTRGSSADGEGYAVATERPDGVLVAARQHVITVLSDAQYAENLVTGINYMKLEFDFIVSEG